MSLLCLDIAFASMGWAVMEKGKVLKCGTIKTEKTKNKQTRVSDDRAWRAAILSKELNEIIVDNNVGAVVGELPSGSQNAIAANLLGMAMGVVVGVIESNGLPVEWISPTDSKKYATGKRSASKEEVMQWCRDKHPYFDFPKFKNVFEHVADAIMAYHGLATGNLVKLFG
jgi:Holliday junction resolvasome RuvABC endonuclease subunit